MSVWMLVSAKAAGGVESSATWGGGGAPSRYGPAARGEWTGDDDAFFLVLAGDACFWQTEGSVSAVLDVQGRTKKQNIRVAV